MEKFKLEIRNNSFSEEYELWKHIIDKNDILYPIKYSTLIDSSENLNFMVEKAKKDFGVSYQNINFTRQ